MSMDLMEPARETKTAPVPLTCPSHQLPLDVHPGGDDPCYECAQGCRFPVRGGIPRFVPKNNYASSFGLQWKKYQKTQLDSYTGHPISADRLARCLGGDLEAACVGNAFWKQAAVCGPIHRRCCSTM